MAPTFELEELDVDTLVAELEAELELDVALLVVVILENTSQQVRSHTNRRHEEIKPPTHSTR